MSTEKATCYFVENPQHEQSSRCQSQCQPGRNVSFISDFHLATMLTYDRLEQERAQRERDNSEVGFLRLSPELRNRIYKDTIPASARISVLERLSQKEISVLQLCRTIRKETVPIFYGKSLFSFDLRSKTNFTRAKSWVDSLSPDAVASLRRLYFQSSISCHCQDARTKSPCKNLYAWVDVGSDVHWSRYGVDADKCCTKTDAARAQVRKIKGMALKQAVHKQDLLDLLEIMRPILAYEFPFDMARIGAYQAFQTSPWQTAQTNLVMRRQIKHARAKRS